MSTNEPRYGWQDFADDDSSDAVPGKQILTITDEGEELAVIVHRHVATLHNERMMDAKRESAQAIVDALNAALAPAALHDRAIGSAADKFFGERLPFWDESEYVRGICEVLADTFGTDDPDSAKSEVWEKINAAHQRAALTAHAQKIARRISGDIPGTMDPETIVLDHADLIAALTAAALAGMTEKEDAR